MNSCILIFGQDKLYKCQKIHFLWKLIKYHMTKTHAMKLSPEFRSDQEFIRCMSSDFLKNIHVKILCSDQGFSRSVSMISSGKYSCQDILLRSRIQSLHVLFTLYSAFTNSQHFNQLARSTLWIKKKSWSGFKKSIICTLQGGRKLSRRTHPPTVINPLQDPDPGPCFDETKAQIWLIDLENITQSSTADLSILVFLGCVSLELDWWWPPG